DIEQEGRDDRSRDRIRARAALIATPGEYSEVGLGVATGGDDPVSSNQTLGSFGTKKDIDLDLAYATWKPVENTGVTFGKFVNPFYTVEKSQLIWDSDFRPEGAALYWKGDTLFAAAVYSFLESDSAA